MADQWEEAASQYKPSATAAPAPITSGNEDWKLWQTGAPSGGGNVPLGDQPATPLGVAKTFINQGVEGAKGALKGAARTVYDLGSTVLPMPQAVGDKVHKMTEPTGTAQTVGSYLPDAAMMLMPGGALEQGAKLLPSAERAGMKLGQVAKAVGSAPVNIDAAAPAALRAQELSEAAFSRPKVLKTVLNRLSPGADPVGWQEASDLATNAGKLSAKESQALKGPMAGQVKQLAKALRESNQAAADQAGVGDLYKGAITEYRRAKKLGEAGDAAIRVAKKAIIPAVAGAAGYSAYKEFGGN